MILQHIPTISSFFRYRKISLILLMIVSMVIGGCSSTKTADEFLNDYCKCVHNASNDAERKKCEAGMVSGMAEQMKDAENDPAQREQTQALIREATKKLIEMRKKCWDTTTVVSPSP